MRSMRRWTLSKKEQRQMLECASSISYENGQVPGRACRAQCMTLSMPSPPPLSPANCLGRGHSGYVVGRREQRHGTATAEKPCMRSDMWPRAVRRKFGKGEGMDVPRITRLELFPEVREVGRDWGATWRELGELRGHAVGASRRVWATWPCKRSARRKSPSRARKRNSVDLRGYVGLAS